MQEMSLDQERALHESRIAQEHRRMQDARTIAESFGNECARYRSLPPATGPLQGKVRDEIITWLSEQRSEYLRISDRLESGLDRLRNNRP